MQAAMKDAKAAIMAIIADNLVHNARPVHASPRSDVPMLKQPIFDWKWQILGQLQL